jgi:hypothetical protein
METRAVTKPGIHKDDSERLETGDPSGILHSKEPYSPGVLIPEVHHRSVDLET